MKNKKTNVANLLQYKEESDKKAQLIAGVAGNSRHVVESVIPMQRLKNTPLVIAALLVPTLVVFMVFPVTALAAGSSGCPTCGMVWKDSCAPFERNNEPAYIEEFNASFSHIASNLTSVLDWSTESWTNVPDVSNESWSNAFLAAHTILKERYAFTQWKAINWNALYNTYAPWIADAEKRQDKAAYVRTLREYQFSIPDGHVQLEYTDDFGAIYADVGGGYGLSVIQLDSGRVIVSYVANGSAAEKSGIRPGDEVTAWNGKKIHDAINATPYIWARMNPSTAEGIRIQKQQFLTRAPVGTPAMVVVSGKGDLQPRLVNLTAFDDRYDSYSKSVAFLDRQSQSELVTYRTLPGGYSYIAILVESYGVYQPFKSAMLATIANNSPGVILDLRNNGGGDDNLASCFAGWFVDKPVFYEYGTKYDPGSRQFPVVWEIWTQPQPTSYHGPVAVLVSPSTISSGEGLPMVFANSHTGKIISPYGTNGAFGMVVSPGVRLPLNVTLNYPDGASLDQNSVIQVDSNASRAGGVAPQIRVPVNEDTVARYMAGEDVQLTYAVKWLDDQVKQGTPSAPMATTTPTQRASPGIGIVVLAVGLFMVMMRRK